MDSSAGQGISQRRGVERVRRLEAKCLWVQDGLKEKAFELGAAHTSEDLADIGTKTLNEATPTKRRPGIELIYRKP